MKNQDIHSTKHKSANTKDGLPFEIPLFYLDKWQSLLDLITNTFKIPYSQISLYNKHNLTPIISNTSQNSIINKSSTIPINKNSLCYEMIKTKKPFRTDNIDDLKNNYANPLNIKISSFIGFPINSDANEILGTICIFNSPNIETSSPLQSAISYLGKQIETDIYKILKQSNDSNNQSSSNIVYKILFEHSNSVNCFFNRNFQLEIYNRRFEDLYKKDINFLKTGEGSPSDKEYFNAFKQRLHSIFETKQSKRFQVHYCTKEKELWLESDYIPVIGDNNTVTGVQIIAQDITNQKLIELEGEEAEVQFKNIFNQSPIGIAIFSSEGNCIEINQNAQEIFGFTGDSNISTFNLFNSPIIPEDLVEQLKNQLKISFKTNINLDQAKDLQLPISFKKTKQDIDFIISPLIVKNRVNGYIAQMRDITEALKTEKALKNYERIYNLVANPICIADINGVFTKVNPAFPKTLGYTREEIEGSPMFRFIHPDDLLPTINYIQDKIAQKAEILYFENRYICKDGSTVWLSWISQPVFAEQISFAIAHDITELKTVQEQLLFAKERAEESDQLKTAFICNMSHEIRTPMNGIIGLSDILSQTDIDEHDRVQYAEIINDSCQQLLHIVNDIIDISKIETGQVQLYMTPVPINDLLDELNAFYLPVASKKSIELKHSYTLSHEKSIIQCDATKLRQILDNLISNAIKFTHEGYVRFGYTVENSFMKFHIKDSGIGIPESFNDTIFERFRQAEEQMTSKYGGTGLGLSISKAYIEKLGGAIWFESDVHKGTTFYFTLPIHY